MGSEFLARARKTTAITALFIFLVVVTYWDLAAGSGWLLGCIWSLVNIHFIGLLVRAVLAPGPKSRLRVAIIFLVKVPLLYTIGFLLLRSGWLPVVALLSGSLWPLLVFMLKILGRALLRLDDPKRISASTKPMEETPQE